MEVYFVKYGELIKEENHDNIIVQDLFKQCFHNYYEGLHRYAFTIVKDNEEAKDIVQSAFSKFWQKREQINIQHSAKSYLYTSVYNLALNAIRNKKVKVRYQQYHLNRPPEENQFDNSREKELTRKVNEAIQALPGKCREVFLKSRVEEKKYIEIAGELKISVKTVESHMGNALKTLRSLLKDILTVVVAIIHFHN